MTADITKSLDEIFSFGNGRRLKGVGEGVGVPVMLYHGKCKMADRSDGE